MSNVVNFTKEYFKKKKKDDRLSWITYQTTWSLMIAGSLNRDEVVFALGYPGSEHEIHAVRNWVKDNQSQLTGKTPLDAVRLATHELTTKLDDYYGNRLWQRPDEYER